ncbi:hypothetical protein E2562_016084 [Oryza meyeriana var. granulata]|uniref:Xylanase inhibitor N-terminal domain-containing protein n=1 Tax=Oryza meyeriana var. granulata TaxID=110450 RepID=A0A6G1BLM2_9ORYZ|nr:hypothetical protein E2562_016084 [Oryza meyeriana var. granulata]
MKLISDKCGPSVHSSRSVQSKYRKYGSKGTGPATEPAAEPLSTLPAARQHDRPQRRGAGATDLAPATNVGEADLHRHGAEAADRAVPAPEAVDRAASAPEAADRAAPPPEAADRSAPAGDGGWDGGGGALPARQSSALLSCGGKAWRRVVFGCEQVQTGSFLDGAAADDLMGARHGEVSLSSSLASSGLVNSDSFSMCFSRNGVYRINFGYIGNADQGETPFIV